MALVSAKFGTFSPKGVLVYERQYLVGDLDTTVNLYIHNQGGDALYFQVEIDDPARNWTFSDGTTIKNLGGVNGASSKRLPMNLIRPAPAGDVEEEINLIIRAYSDSGYTNLVYEYTWPIEVYIVDFDNSPNWVVLQRWDFDDRTAQGWTGNLTPGMSNRISVNPGGWSIKCSSSFKYLESPDVTLPNASKILLLGYFTYRFSASSGSGNVSEIRIKFGGTEVLSMTGIVILASSSEGYVGWNQFATDITPLGGTSGRVRMEFDLSSYSELYVDNIAIVYRP